MLLNEWRFLSHLIHFLVPLMVLEEYRVLDVGGDGIHGTLGEFGMFPDLRHDCDVPHELSLSRPLFLRRPLLVGAPLLLLLALRLLLVLRLLDSVRSFPQH